MYTLNLEHNEIDLLLSGLGELPAKQSFDLINKIHKQVGEKLKEIEKEKEEYNNWKKVNVK